jgi:hypothetical protein
MDDREVRASLTKRLLTVHLQQGFAVSRDKLR